METSTRIAGLLLSLAGSFARAEFLDDKPEALARAQNARSSAQMATARLELVVRKLNSKKDSPTATLYSTWICAQDRYMRVMRGDAEGVLRRNETGQPAEFTHNGPDSWLVMDGRAWRHTEDSPGADAYVKGEEYINLWDVRSIGLRAGYGSDSDWEQDCRAAGLDIAWSEREDNGLTVVTGKIKDGAVSWWIDPAKNWNVVKNEVFVNDQKIGEARLTLEQYDGVWYPKRTEYFQCVADGTTKPFLLVETLAAEFNRPEHPQQLTPADIGIEVGTEVTFHKAGGQYDYDGLWDGFNAVPMDEFSARRKSGELQVGPGVARRSHRLRMEREAEKAAGQSPQIVLNQKGGAAKSRIESEWEAYTRRFIEAHDLDKEQRARAENILKSCQDRAWEHVSKHQREFDEFETLEKKTREARAENPAAATQPARQLEERRAKLLEPIVAIFDNELKPRLDRLPTRAQHETAKQRGWPSATGPDSKKP